MKKRLLGILLSLAMMLTMMPVLGLSLTAYADDDPPYAQYKNTTTVITFDGKSWYLIDYDANSVTLLAKECVGDSASAYNSSASFVEYSQSTVKTAVDNWYNSSITADAKTAVSGNAMFLLTTSQANVIYSENPNVLECPVASGAGANGWWLYSQGVAAYVDCDDGSVNDGGLNALCPLGVRPALKLDLSKVEFDSSSNAFSIPTLYPLWVGGTQVTSDKLSDTGWSYDPSDNILTLNNADITTEDTVEHAGIYYNGSTTLNIVLKGDRHRRNGWSRQYNNQIRHCERHRYGRKWHRCK